MNYISKTSSKKNIISNNVPAGKKNKVFLLLSEKILIFCVSEKKAMKTEKKISNILSGIIVNKYYGLYGLQSLKNLLDRFN